MKKMIPLLLLPLIWACNNKAEKKETEDSSSVSTNNVPNNGPASGTTAESNMQVSINGAELNLNASALVTKDDKNLKAGAPWFAMLTGSNGPNDESLILNFVFDTKPGQYPVVGVGLNRGTGEEAEVYGGLMGGTPKITEYKVTLTEVKDLGDNQLGGHRWSLSGVFEDMTVPANSLMLIDQSRNHPKEASIRGGRFSNITFDDNWEDILKKAFDKSEQ